MSKVKVIWLCHFTNQEIQVALPLWKNKQEFASWIPNMARAFEGENNYEHHIVSPHEYLKKVTSLKLRGIYYHFIPFGFPILRRHWPRFFRYDIWSNYKLFRRNFINIVENIKPELLCLIGAENAYYSSAVFDVYNKIPTLVGIQGFISQFKNDPMISFEVRNRIKIEEKILTEFTEFFGEIDSSNYIKCYNQGHNFYKVFFPINEDILRSTKFIGHKYDLIYFGRMNYIKGAHDFVKVVAAINKSMPNIKAVMVGGGDITPIHELAVKLQCEKNIDFKGFVETQVELFRIVKSAKIFLVPPYRERFSSTMREAMALRVPIIAYATGGIPLVNEKRKNILLTEPGDIQMMAKLAIDLLNDENKRESLIRSGYDYYLEEFSSAIFKARMIEAYNHLLMRD